jgi:mutator protein MutT
LSRRTHTGRLDTVADASVLVAAAVIVRAGRLLLARRRAEGRWELPGGKVEPGETLAECLRRELSEELGIDARVGRRVCSAVHRTAARTIVLEALAVEGFDGEPEPREHDALAWALPEEWGGFELLEPDVALLACVRERWTELQGGEPRGR